MINLLWRTDAHLSDVAPASRTDDWAGTVFNKLTQTKLVARKVKAAAILDGGDFFHIKSPSRTSHRLVQQVAIHHADYPCPVYCTPGNHDSVYGDYSHLPQQPLGVLYAAGIFKRLYDEHEAVFETEPEIHGHMGEPSLGGIKIRVVGIPYHGRSYDYERLAAIKKGDEDYLVVVAHLLASPQGGTMFENEDILKYEDLAQLPPDMWLFGHWHKDQGIQQVNGKWFVNMGSLTRGSIVQDEVERKPAIVLLSFASAGIDVQILRLRVQHPDEVFDMDGRVRAEARETTMDAFVASVKETLVDAREIKLEESVESMTDLPDQVRERAVMYLERVG